MASVIYCPICAKELKQWYDYMENTLMEYSVRCPDEHYSVDFAFGLYEVYVGSELFAWAYKDTLEHIGEMSIGIEKQIEIEKERLSS